MNYLIFYEVFNSFWYKMLILDSIFGILKKKYEKMILFDSYLKSFFYFENLYKYFEKKI